MGWRRRRGAGGDEDEVGDEAQGGRVELEREEESCVEEHDVEDDATELDSEAELERDEAEALAQQMQKRRRGSSARSRFSLPLVSEEERMEENDVGLRSPPRGVRLVRTESIRPHELRAMILSGLSTEERAEFERNQAMARSAKKRQSKVCDLDLSPNSEANEDSSDAGDNVGLGGGGNGNCTVAFCEVELSTPQNRWRLRKAWTMALRDLAAVSPLGSIPFPKSKRKRTHSKEATLL